MRTYALVINLVWCIMKYRLYVRHDLTSPYVDDSDYWPNVDEPLPEVGSLIDTPEGRAKLTKIVLDNPEWTAGFCTVVMSATDDVPIRSRFNKHTSHTAR